MRCSILRLRKKCNSLHTLEFWAESQICAAFYAILQRIDHCAKSICGLCTKQLWQGGHFVVQGCPRTPYPLMWPPANLGQIQCTHMAGQLDVPGPPSSTEGLKSFLCTKSVRNLPFILFWYAETRDKWGGLRTAVAPALLLVWEATAKRRQKSTFHLNPKTALWNFLSVRNSPEWRLLCLFLMYWSSGKIFLHWSLLRKTLFQRTRTQEKLEENWDQQTRAESILTRLQKLTCSWRAFDWGCGNKFCSELFGQSPEKFGLYIWLPKARKEIFWYWLLCALVNCTKRGTVNEYSQKSPSETLLDFMAHEWPCDVLMTAFITHHL